VLPVAPCGIPKLNTAADELPLFVTVAFDPGESVDVVPTEIVAALPDGPALPVGIPKFKTTFDELPELVTVALAPGVNVVVVPTVTFDATRPTSCVDPSL